VAYKSSINSRPANVAIGWLSTAQHSTAQQGLLAVAACVVGGDVHVGGWQQWQQLLLTVLLSCVVVGMWVA
jgi:hypothetical protein